MSGPLIFSRRRFLQQAGAFSALSLAGTLDRLGLSGAAAQTSDYKALVCIFLFGGNDSNSFLIPTTTQGYTDYSTVRNAASGVQIPLVDLQANQVSPANTPGVTYGLHPAFTAVNGNPTLRDLFNTGKMAVVLNTATLIEPLTRTEYRARSKRAPDNLFSHSDQQQQFMSSVSQATLTAVTGWGGRFADRLLALNAANATPMAMSFSGTQTFGNGIKARMLALPSSGNFGFSGDSTTAQPGSAAYERAAARRAMLAATDSDRIVAASQVTAKAAQDASLRLSPIIAGAGSTSITTPFTGLNTGISNQLKAVARVIEQRATLGHSRQIFFVSMGGFDTHSGQGTTSTGSGLPLLYLQLGQALSAFYQATVNLGVAANVTSFTLSDFNRTLKGNGAGTDHAWGGHHLVVGGSVVGNNVYGTYPTLALSGPDDADSSGRWIPTQSIEQYGATLGRWFGVPDVDLAQVFPNLGRFPTANLGFLG